MAGPALDRELIAPRDAGVGFSVATGREEAALRRLLRANPMGGAIRLTFEREPDYFRGDGVAGGEDRTIVAREGGQLVCMGRCSSRLRHINGVPARVGYLGELRLDGMAQGRFDILRRGYRFFHELDRSDPPAFRFTSIASDNERSIRFLERGLPGMPRYDFLTGFASLLVSVPGTEHAIQRLAGRAQKRLSNDGLRCVPGSRNLVEPMTACLNHHAGLHQLSTEWTPEQLLAQEQWGMSLADCIVVLERERVVACGALWDQRGFRQTVIHGNKFAATARPWFNLVAGCFGMARIPEIGSTLAHAFLSPLAVDAQRDDVLASVVEMALTLARQRGLDFLTIGFAAGDARREIIRSQFQVREYASRLYRVSWPDETDVVSLDGRPFLPEVALL